MTTTSGNNKIPVIIEGNKLINWSVFINKWSPLLLYVLFREFNIFLFDFFSYYVENVSGSPLSSSFIPVTSSKNGQPGESRRSISTRLRIFILFCGCLASISSALTVHIYYPSLPVLEKVSRYYIIVAHKYVCDSDELYNDYGNRYLKLLLWYFNDNVHLEL